MRPKRVERFSDRGPRRWLTIRRCLGLTTLLLALVSCATIERLSVATSAPPVASMNRGVPHLAGPRYAPHRATFTLPSPAPTATPRPTRTPYPPTATPSRPGRALTAYFPDLDNPSFEAERECQPHLAMDRPYTPDELYFDGAGDLQLTGFLERGHKGYQEDDLLMHYTITARRG